MKGLRALLLVVGVAFLALLVATNDPAAIWASLRQLSWRFVIVAVFPFVLVTVFDTLGWRYAFLRDRVGLTTLLAIRMAGEAFNLATPTASVGGEAVKVWLLRGRAPLDDAMLSVVVAKTTIMIGQGILLIVGIMAASTIVAPGSPLLGWMVWLLGLEVVLIGAFVIAQLRGPFGWVRGLLQRVGLGGDTLVRVDRGLAWFYRNEPRRLALSIGCHLVAWLLGALEAWLILHLLGIDASLTTATVIEAFGTAIRFATFLVPASLGALEGGYVGTFSALGLSSAAGVAFGLTRRLREIVWVVAGFLIFARLRPDPIAVSPER